MATKRSLLHQWCENGTISPSDISKALEVSGVLPEARSWQLFLDRLLLWTGAVSLSFSVIFFFAYNWHAMGKFAKFALVEAAVIAAVIGYWKLGHNRASGKAALLTAAILLGGLLALFGQTYQTGADPWQLFANWALLILPWVLTGCFAPLWLVWIGLVNVSLFLYFSIFPGFWGLFFSFEGLMVIAFFFNTAALIAWELGSPIFVWLQQRWAVRIIAVLSGSAITGVALETILDWHDTSGWSVVMYPLWLAGIYLSYRRAVKDLFMLAGMCLSLIVVIIALLSRAFLDHDAAPGFLLIAIAVIAMSAVSAVWLRNINKEMEQ